MRDIPSAKNLALPALIVVSIFISQLMRAKEAIPTWRYEGQIMGTTFSVKVRHPTEVKLELISDALEAVNDRMSTYQPSSELSLINKLKAKEVMTLSSPLREVLNAARQVYQQSEGAFDIAVGPLVNAWGFGPNKERQMPSALEIEHLKTLIGADSWTLNDQGVSRSSKDVYLDLSAIAKGYAVDRVALALDQAKVNNYWVEVGGEIRVKGLNGEGHFWRVGIERPAGKGKRRIFKIIDLNDQSLATSGDYRNRYVDSTGVTRSHTIDPTTGEPVTHTLASVSVLHEDCMYADAWATALNVLGAKRGLELANTHKVAALFITREGITNESQDLDGAKTQYVAIESEEMTRYLKEIKP